MKSLFIVRHGKSSWDLNSIKDIDRPLNERGISDGYKMATRLLNKSLKPELIISSNANRALHSATIFHRVLELHAETIKIEPDLYHAGVDEIMNVIYSVDDRINSLMIFGHNPGFTELANYLSRLNIDNVPTTGMVSLEFDTNQWNKVGSDVLVKEDFDFPRKK